jgi:hypothetical protein
MKAKVTIAALLTAGLAGCAYPTSTITQGADTGRLKFTGPPGAGIRIDGRDRGIVSKDSPLIVDVPAGRHRIEEIIEGRSILDRNYEVGAGSTLDIGG